MQATEVAKIWPQKDYCQRFEKEYLSGHQSTQWHSNHHTLWLLFNYFKLSFSSYQLSLQSFVVLPLLVVVLQRNFLWLLLLIQLHLQQWGLATAGTTKKLSVTVLTNSISTVRAWLWNMENNNFFGIWWTITSLGSIITPLTVFPFTHSVARELDAIAEPQPNVLNLASTILPSSSILIWKKDKFLNTYYYAKVVKTTTMKKTKDPPKKHYLLLLCSQLLENT